MADEIDREKAAQNEKDKKRSKEQEKLNKEVAKALGLWTEELETSTEVMESSYAKLSGVLVGGVTKSFMGAATSAMASGDAMATAAGFMKSNVDMLGSGFKVGTDSMIRIGNQLAKEGNNNGRYMAAAGQALGALTGAVQELTKAGIDFMLKETNKMIDGFRQMSSVGAVYSGGLEAMTATALGAGMTVEQFSKSVAANTDNFTKSGLGVAEGSRKMAASMKAGGDSARNGMFALGMTMEEQADAYAATMARLAGPAGKLQASDAQVAELTEQYARDLKLVSDLTGKSAKEQQQEAEARSNNFKMQQELAKMDPVARDKFNKALGAMTEDSAKAIQDRIAHGGAVTDKNVAILEQASPALKAMHEEEFRLAQQGKLDAEAEMNLRKKYGDQIESQLANQGALATAAHHGLSGLDEMATKAMKEYGKMGSANVQEEKDKIAKQQREGKLGKDSAADLMSAQQNMAIQMQEIASKHFPDFKNALISTIDQIKGAVGVAANGGTFLASLLSGPIGLLGQVLLSGVGGFVASKVAARGAASAGGSALEKTLGGAGGALEKVGGAVGGGAGGGIGGGLKGLAEGFAMLANPATLVGMAAFTVAAMGLGKALEYAAPAIEAMGKAASAILVGIADSLIKMATEVNPLKLLAIAPGIAAIGIAMLPFGVGGALAGIVGGTGGFDAVVAGIQKFEQLDPNRLMAVAGAMKKINESLPTAADLAKMAAVGVMDNLFGGGSKTGGGSTSGGDTNTAKLMQDMLKEQKQTNDYLRASVDLNKKIHNAVA